MKYLKLFESFRDDFYKSVNDLKSEYDSNRKELFNNAKKEVDDFMFDLTDRFSDQKTYQNDFIEDDDLSVWYHLKCKPEYFVEFIKTLIDVEERISSALGLEISVTLGGLSQDYVHPLNNGNHFKLNQLLKWIGDIEGGYRKKFTEVFSNLDQFTFKIQVF